MNQLGIVGAGVAVGVLTSAVMVRRPVVIDGLPQTSQALTIAMAPGSLLAVTAVAAIDMARNGGGYTNVSRYAGLFGLGQMIGVGVGILGHLPYLLNKTAP